MYYREDTLSHNTRVMCPDCILQIFGRNMTLWILFAVLSLWAFSFSFTCICSSLWEMWGKRRGRPCRVRACIYLTQSYFSKHLLGLYSWTLPLSLALHCHLLVRPSWLRMLNYILHFLNYQTSIFEFAP